MVRIPFVRHRTVNQLWNKYRACRAGVEKTRWQAVWRLARTDTPRTPAPVADVVGLSAVTVRQVLHRWNADGPAGLADGRTGNGSAPKLSARRRAALLTALHKRPPDGGLWTGPKVARYVADRWGVADALAAFAAHADPDGTKVLVLIVDNAGWHTAKRLAVPGNVRLHFLPPCTPELQPVEPFWALVREGVANDTFDRLGQLRRVIRRRCRKLAADTATVFGAVGFRWAVTLEE